MNDRDVNEAKETTMTIKHMWPTPWIEAARDAKLLRGSDATTGKIFIAYGLRDELAAFALAIQAAERERCLQICRMNDPEGFATHLIEAGDNA